MPGTPSEQDSAWFQTETEFHERLYLRGTNPRQQSGFGRDERDWERFRRPVVAAIERSGTFLDVGCANGLLMEDVRRWAHEDGYIIEPYGLDISEKLVALARRRLPHWHERIYVGNALYWQSPFRFDYVRTELVYVPRKQHSPARKASTAASSSSRTSRTCSTVHGSSAFAT